MFQTIIVNNANNAFAECQLRVSVLGLFFILRIQVGTHL